MFNTNYDRPLTQGIDYDAKIAIYDVPVSIVSEGKSSPLSEGQLSKHLDIRVIAGEALAAVHIWSEKEGRTNSNESTTEIWTEDPGGSLPIFRGSCKFPTEYPINRLLKGREGDVINVRYKKRTYRFLCAQREATHSRVNATRLFQDAVVAQKEAVAWSESSIENSSKIDFDFPNYVREFLEKHVPKITGVPEEISPEFESISTQKPDEVFRQFQRAIVENSPSIVILCVQLRKRLILRQEPDLWYDLHSYLKFLNNPTGATKELIDVCVAVANYRPNISQQYAVNHSLDVLMHLRTTEMLIKKITEAKSINCQVVVRRIKQMLGL